MKDCSRPSFRVPQADSIRLEPGSSRLAPRGAEPASRWLCGRAGSHTRLGILGLGAQTSLHRTTLHRALESKHLKRLGQQTHTPSSALTHRTNPGATQRWEWGLGERRRSSWKRVKEGYSPDKKHLAKSAEVSAFASPRF